MNAADKTDETQVATPEEMQRLVARSLAPGAIPVDQAPGMFPDRMGKYPISHFLAHGGMGDVFLGSHPDLDIPVAIKTIKGNIETTNKTNM